MRTTIRFDDELLKAIKRAAAERGCTITAVVEDAVRQVLGRRQGPPREHIELPVWEGGELRPGVDLDDSAPLLDIMEGRKRSCPT